jgi:hypothetical protein
MDQESQQALKQAFAEALLRTPDDPFKAAFSVTTDNGLACQIATNWPKDREVAQFQVALIEEKGAKTFLPDKEQQARDVYKIAEAPNLDPEVKLKAHRLYAEIMGHIQDAKHSGGVQIANFGVMVVKEKGSDDEWEQSAVVQQRNLIAHA